MWYKLHKYIYIIARALSRKRPSISPSKFNPSERRIGRIKVKMPKLGGNCEFLLNALSSDLLGKTGINAARDNLFRVASFKLSQLAVCESRVQERKMKSRFIWCTIRIYTGNLSYNFFAIAPLQYPPRDINVAYHIIRALPYYITMYNMYTLYYIVTLYCAQFRQFAAAFKWRGHVSPTSPTSDSAKMRAALYSCPFCLSGVRKCFSLLLPGGRI